jgi:hypothetical protein
MGGVAKRQTILPVLSFTFWGKFLIIRHVIAAIGGDRRQGW